MSFRRHQTPPPFWLIFHNLRDFKRRRNAPPGHRDAATLVIGGRRAGPVGKARETMVGSLTAELDWNLKSDAMSAAAGAGEEPLRDLRDAEAHFRPWATG